MLDEDGIIVMNYKSGFLLLTSFVFCLVFAGELHAETFYHKSKGGVKYYTNVKPKGNDYTKIRSNWGRSKSSTKSLRDHGRYEYSAEYDHIIRQAAAKYNLDPNLIKAMIKVESNFYADAISPKGAQGLMQLMPPTASRMGVINAFDSRDNIMGGSKYFRFLLDLFDENKTLAIAGYNAGENAVIKYGYEIPPYRETEGYVDKVFAHYKNLQKKDSKLAVKKAPKIKPKYKDNKEEKNNGPSIVYRETLDSVEITPQSKSTVIVKSVEYYDRKGSLENTGKIKTTPGGEYTVQIASFPTMDNAKEMEESLKSKTYPAYIKAANLPNKGTWYRVRIGEFTTKQEALLYMENLKREQPHISSPIVTSIN